MRPNDVSLRSATRSDDLIWPSWIRHLGFLDQFPKIQESAEIERTVIKTNRGTLMWAKKRCGKKSTFSSFQKGFSIF